MVAERANDLARDIQCQLKEKCKHFIAYSIVTDKGNDVKDIAQLAVFIWGVNEDSELAVEFFELVCMKRKTGADEISLNWQPFQTNLSCFGKNGWLY
jgi:hypothetical protein